MDFLKPSPLEYEYLFFKLVYIDFIKHIDPLWPSDAAWRYRFESTLARVMDCCLATPSHYLNQCQLIINRMWAISCLGHLYITKISVKFAYIWNYLHLNFIHTSPWSSEFIRYQCKIWNNNFMRCTSIIRSYFIDPGHLFTKKATPYWYRDSHYKTKTVWPS